MQTMKIISTASLIALGIGSLFTGCTFNHSNDPVQVEGQNTETSEQVGGAKAAGAKPVLAKASEKAAVGKPVKVAVVAKPAAKAKAPAAAEAKAPAAAEAKVAAPAPLPAAGEERVIRYVTADLLNVHTSPHMDSPVTAKIKRGSMFTVSIEGDWAKLSDGQFVLSKYLSRKQASGYRVVMGR